MLPSETSAPPHPLPLQTHSAIPTSNSEICAKDFEETTDGNFRNPWNCLQLLCQTAQGCLNPAVCILWRFRMLHGMIPHAAKIVREFLRVGPRPQPQQQWTGVKRNEHEMNTINEAATSISSVLRFTIRLAISQHPSPASSMWTHIWEPCPLRFSFWAATSLGRYAEIDLQSNIYWVLFYLTVYWYSLMLLNHNTYWDLMMSNEFCSEILYCTETDI